METLPVANNKGLSRRPRPNQSLYQAAIRNIILNIQGDLTDAELGERLGCSSGTISNARNKKGNLCGVTLARIGDEFGPEAIEPFTALFGSIAVHRESQAANDMATIAGISHVAGDWIERLRDGVRCHNDTIALADSLRPHLAALTAIMEEAEKHRAEAA